VAERAAILEINPDGSGKRIFANGLRNPNGIVCAEIRIRPAVAQRPAR
jgi:glucose/arabinose dehydrogenase